MPKNSSRKNKKAASQASSQLNKSDWGSQQGRNAGPGDQEQPKSAQSEVEQVAHTMLTRLQKQQMAEKAARSEPQLGPGLEKTRPESKLGSDLDNASKWGGGRDQESYPAPTKLSKLLAEATAKEANKYIVGDGGRGHFGREPAETDKSDELLVGAKTKLTNESFDKHFAGEGGQGQKNDLNVDPSELDDSLVRSSEELTNKLPNNNIVGGGDRDHHGCVSAEPTKVSSLLDGVHKVPTNNLPNNNIVGGGGHDHHGCETAEPNNVNSLLAGVHEVPTNKQPNNNIVGGGGHDHHGCETAEPNNVNSLLAGVHEVPTNKPPNNNTVSGGGHSRHGCSTDPTTNTRDLSIEAAPDEIDKSKDTLFTGKSDHDPKGRRITEPDKTSDLLATTTANEPTNSIITDKGNDDSQTPVNNSISQETSLGGLVQAEVMGPTGKIQVWVTKDVKAALDSALSSKQTDSEGQHNNKSHDPDKSKSDTDNVKSPNSEIDKLIVNSHKSATNDEIGQAVEHMNDNIITNSQHKRNEIHATVSDGSHAHVGSRSARTTATNNSIKTASNHAPDGSLTAESKGYSGHTQESSEVTEPNKLIDKDSAHTTEECSNAEPNQLNTNSQVSDEGHPCEGVINNPNTLMNSITNKQYSNISAGGHTQTGCGATASNKLIDKDSAYTNEECLNAEPNQLNTNSHVSDEGHPCEGLINNPNTLMNSIINVQSNVGAGAHTHTRSGDTEPNELIGKDNAHTNTECLSAEPNQLITNNVNIRDEGHPREGETDNPNTLTGNTTDMQNRDDTRTQTGSLSIDPNILVDNTIIEAGNSAHTYVGSTNTEPGLPITNVRTSDGVHARMGKTNTNPSKSINNMHSDSGPTQDGEDTTGTNVLIDSAAIDANSKAQRGVLTVNTNNLIDGSNSNHTSKNGGFASSTEFIVHVAEGNGYCQETQPYTTTNTVNQSECTNTQTMEGTNLYQDELDEHGLPIGTVYVEMPDGKIHAYTAGWPAWTDSEFDEDYEDYDYPQQEHQSSNTNHIQSHVNWESPKSAIKTWQNKPTRLINKMGSEAEIPTQPFRLETVTDQEEGNTVPDLNESQSQESEIEENDLDVSQMNLDSTQDMEELDKSFKMLEDLANEGPLEGAGHIDQVQYIASEKDLAKYQKRQAQFDCITQESEQSICKLSALPWPEGPLDTQNTRDLIKDDKAKPVPENIRGTALKTSNMNGHMMLFVANQAKIRDFIFEVIGDRYEINELTTTRAKQIQSDPLYNEEYQGRCKRVWYGPPTESNQTERAPYLVHTTYPEWNRLNATEIWYLGPSDKDYSISEISERALFDDTLFEIDRKAKKGLIHSWQHENFGEDESIEQRQNKQKLMVLEESPKYDSIEKEVTNRISRKRRVRDSADRPTESVESECHLYYTEHPLTLRELKYRRLAMNISSDYETYIVDLTAANERGKKWPEPVDRLPKCTAELWHVTDPQEIRVDAREPEKEDDAKAKGAFQSGIEAMSLVLTLMSPNMEEAANVTYKQVKDGKTRSDKAWITYMLAWRKLRYTMANVNSQLHDTAIRFNVHPMKQEVLNTIQTFVVVYHELTNRMYRASEVSPNIIRRQMIHTWYHAEFVTNTLKTLIEYQGTQFPAQSQESVTEEGYDIAFSEEEQEMLVRSQELHATINGEQINPEGSDSQEANLTDRSPQPNAVPGKPFKEMKARKDSTESEDEYSGNPKPKRSRKTQEAQSKTGKVQKGDPEKANATTQTWIMRKMQAAADMEKTPEMKALVREYDRARKGNDEFRELATMAGLFIDSMSLVEVFTEPLESEKPVNWTLAQLKRSKTDSTSVAKTKNRWLRLLDWMSNTIEAAETVQTQITLLPAKASLTLEAMARLNEVRIMAIEMEKTLLTNSKNWPECMSEAGVQVILVARTVTKAVQQELLGSKAPIEGRLEPTTKELKKQLQKAKNKAHTNLNPQMNENRPSTSQGRKQKSQSSSQQPDKSTSKTTTVPATASSSKTTSTGPQKVIDKADHMPKPVMNVKQRKPLADKTHKSKEEQGITVAEFKSIIMAVFMQDPFSEEAVLNLTDQIRTVEPNSKFSILYLEMAADLLSNQLFEQVAKRLTTNTVITTEQAVSSKPRDVIAPTTSTSTKAGKAKQKPKSLIAPGPVVFRDKPLQDDVLMVLDENGKMSWSHKVYVHTTMGKGEQMPLLDFIKPVVYNTKCSQATDFQVNLWKQANKQTTLPFSYPRAKVAIHKQYYQTRDLLQLTQFHDPRGRALLSMIKTEISENEKTYSARYLPLPEKGLSCFTEKWVSDNIALEGYYPNVKYYEVHDVPGKFIQRILEPKADGQILDRSETEMEILTDTWMPLPESVTPSKKQKKTGADCAMVLPDRNDQSEQTERPAQSRMQDMLNGLDRGQSVFSMGQGPGSNTARRQPGSNTRNRNGLNPLDEDGEVLDSDNNSEEHDQPDNDGYEDRTSALTALVTMMQQMQTSQSQLAQTVASLQRQMTQGAGPSQSAETPEPRGDLYAAETLIDTATLHQPGEAELEAKMVETFYKVYKEKTKIGRVTKPGTTDGFKTQVQKMEKAFDLVPGINDKIKCFLLSQNLDIEASGQYQTLPHATQISFNETKEALGKALGDGMHRHEILAKLTLMKQNTGSETAMDYLRRMKPLLNAQFNAHDYPNEEIRNEQKVAWFVHGLKPCLKQYALLQNPQTCEEAAHFADRNLSQLGTQEPDRKKSKSADENDKDWEGMYKQLDRLRSRRERFENDPANRSRRSNIKEDDEPKSSKYDRQSKTNQDFGQNNKWANQRESGDRQTYNNNGNDKSSDKRCQQCKKAPCLPFCPELKKKGPRVSSVKTDRNDRGTKSNSDATDSEEDIEDSLDHLLDLIKHKLKGKKSTSKQSAQEPDSQDSDSDDDQGAQLNMISVYRGRDGSEGRLPDPRNCYDLSGAAKAWEEVEEAGRIMYGDYDTKCIRTKGEVVVNTMLFGKGDGAENQDDGQRYIHQGIELTGPITEERKAILRDLVGSTKEVDVALGNQKERINVRMLYDTGASVSIISKPDLFKLHRLGVVNMARDVIPFRIACRDFMGCKRQITQVAQLWAQCANSEPVRVTMCTGEDMPNTIMGTNMMRNLFGKEGVWPNIPGLTTPTKPDLPKSDMKHTKGERLKAKLQEITAPKPDAKLPKRSNNKLPFLKSVGDNTKAHAYYETGVKPPKKSDKEEQQKQQKKELLEKVKQIVIDNEKAKQTRQVRFKDENVPIAAQKRVKVATILGKSDEEIEELLRTGKYQVKQPTTIHPGKAKTIEVNLIQDFELRLDQYTENLKQIVKEQPHSVFMMAEPLYIMNQSAGARIEVQPSFDNLGAQVSTIHITNIGNEPVCLKQGMNVAKARPVAMDESAMNAITDTVLDNLKAQEQEDFRGRPKSRQRMKSASNGLKSSD